MLTLNNLEILSTADAGRWQEVLDEIGVYDFYHLPGYHRLAEIRGEGEAVMPVFRKSGYTIAFPMVIRDIDLPFLPEAIGLKDATSVSGFAGPVASTLSLPDEVRLHFHNELQTFFEDNRVLTVFSRLNPVIDQTFILGGYGEIIERGVTVSIDLTLPPDAQFRNYRSTHRKGIRKLINSGYVCERVGTEYLDVFIEIYHDTMDKADAEEQYYYDKSYCEYLIRKMPEVVSLFICRKDNAVVSVALSALCNGIIEGLLSGTASEFRQMSPSKFLYDEIRRWGCEVGARVFHLGGGIAAKRDSLYDFKMGFGGREHTYSTWRYIVDRQTYDNICRDIKGDGAFFPAYRDPEIQTDNTALP